MQTMSQRFLLNDNVVANKKMFCLRGGEGGGGGGQSG